MERLRSNAVVGLGPLAQRLLARRRRWIRWAAVALAALTALTAVAQLRHRPAPHRTVRPQPAVRVEPRPPRAEGVAGVVPVGMRAINLVVPAGATFGARLAPLSRVDVLAAFDVGQDRAVRRVLASAVVLHVNTQGAPASAGAPFAQSAPEMRFGGAPVAEVVLAIPPEREREVALAQAFGRLFVAVERFNVIPADLADAAGGPAPERPSQTAPADAALSLRRYLDLPATQPSATAPAWLRSSAGMIPMPPARPSATPRPAPHTRSVRDVAPPVELQPGHVVVEVVEGTARTTVEVLP